MRLRRLNTRFMVAMSLAWAGLLAVGPIAVLAQEAADAAPAEAPAPEPAAPDGAEAAPAPAPEAPATAPAGQGGPTAEMEAAFANFLHFAVIGQFEIAESHAKALLARPDVNPLTPEAADILLELSDRYENSLDTLLILIQNSSISETAGRVMALVQEAHRRKRMDPAHISDSIQLLAGSPTQRAAGLERLMDAAEYAIPRMLEVLDEPRATNLHPFVLRALPQIGKPAVNPLTAALSVPSATVQRFAAEALGRIGYPHALPYLKRLADDEKANAAVREAAAAAVAAIVVPDPKVKEAPAVAMLADLAERYYSEEPSLMPDPRQVRANVWVVEGNTVKPVEVPAAIFAQVMCMRATRDSLVLDQNQPRAYALWLAANIRREAQLGLDVQTAEVAEVDDATQPAGFPRSLYFARMAGPRHCQLVLSRAVHDLDRDVALGAIAGLASTAGPAALVGGEAGGLGQALVFPDLLVRIKAALALGKAAPAETFREAPELVPVLGSALGLKGQRVYLVLDGDEAFAGRLSTAFGGDGGGVQVLTAPSVRDGLAAVEKSGGWLDGLFVASDLRRPTTIEALRELSRAPRTALVPAVVYVKEGDILVADDLAEADRRAGRVLVSGDDVAPLAEQLLARKNEVAVRYGHREMAAEEGLALALQAAQTLEAMATAAPGRFDVRTIEADLVEALGHPAQELRVAVIRVLAVLDTPKAQSAIARVALSDQQNPDLRVAAFAGLAESAKRFGSRLDDAAMKALVTQAMQLADLRLRTAASQAVGAMNTSGAVATIINPPTQGK